MRVTGHTIGTFRQAQIGMLLVGAGTVVAEVVGSGVAGLANTKVDCR